MDKDVILIKKHEIIDEMNRKWKEKEKIRKRGGLSKEEEDERNEIGSDTESLFVFIASNRERISIARPERVRRYDFITEYKGYMNRVQVKTLHRFGGDWTLRCYGGRKEAYTIDEIDFIVGYNCAYDRWYIIPSSEIKDSLGILIIDGDNCRQKRFMGAWDLLKYR